MRSDPLYVGLAVLAGLGVGLAQDVIKEDSHFYGLSPPVYPSPQSSGTGNWSLAFSKAKDFVAQLTLEEKVNLTAGIISTTGCSGEIPAIPRLNFPGLCLTDAGNGVRSTDFVSAWPSGLHVGASWNKALAFQRAAAMGKEALKKGVNTLLGPVVGPMFRLAEGGRNWEGFAADPYLSGALVAETVTGLQGSGVMACVKHYIGNEQETQRNPYGNVSSVSSNIDDATLHERYLWPFQDALRAGAASIMCSYNRLNNSYSCQNSKLLNGVLKEELGFQGFVVTDWSALHAGYAAADAGLDMVMPTAETFWGDNLTLSVTNGSLSESRIDDMATRIISAWYLVGQDTSIARPGVGMPIDLSVPHDIVDAVDPADKSLLLQGAVEGHVLVKNVNGALPLSRPRTMYLAGYSAREPDQNSPTAAAYGWSLDAESSQATVDNFLSLLTGSDPTARSPVAAYNGTIIGGGGSGGVAVSAFVSPFHAIVGRALEDHTQLFWDFVSAEPTADAAADVCIVFGNAWATEGIDRAGLRDNATDALVESVADSCANTVVVLHTAGARIVDGWIDHPNVTAVVFAHLPGEASGRALASLLYGEDNFSGKLPYSLPRSEADYGSLLSPAVGQGQHQLFPQADFDEGVFVDYRQLDRAAVEPQFEFGFGLSYTTFAYSSLRVQRLVGSSQNLSWAAFPSGPVEQGGQTDLWDVVARVSAVVFNTGRVAGQEVAQLYIGIPGAPVRQLRGFEKVAIAAGQSASVTFSLTRKDLSVWDVTAQKWNLQRGNYSVYVGSSSRKLPLQSFLIL